MLAEVQTIDLMIAGKEICLARFYHEGFEFELFGQAVPCIKQRAYRHMVIENWLLKSRGAAFREKIIALKQSGHKTEFAFAKLLGLEGNPYEALLQLEGANDVL